MVCCGPNYVRIHSRSWFAVGFASLFAVEFETRHCGICTLIYVKSTLLIAVESAPFSIAIGSPLIPQSRSSIRLFVCEMGSMFFLFPPLCSLLDP
jgi:hypothetical protein